MPFLDPNWTPLQSFILSLIVVIVPVIVALIEMSRRADKRDEEVKEIKKETKVISHEVRPNGGSSMADTVNRIADRLDAHMNLIVGVSKSVERLREDVGEERRERLEMDQKLRNIEKHRTFEPRNER